MLPWELVVDQVGLILGSDNRFLFWQKSVRFATSLAKVVLPLVDLGSENELVRFVRA